MVLPVGLRDVAQVFFANHLGVALRFNEPAELVVAVDDLLLGGDHVDGFIRVDQFFPILVYLSCWARQNFMLAFEGIAVIALEVEISLSLCSLVQHDGLEELVDVVEVRGVVVLETHLFEHILHFSYFLGDGDDLL